jgi:hypothetical protein
MLTPKRPVHTDGKTNHPVISELIQNQLRIYFARYLDCFFPVSTGSEYCSQNEILPLISASST